MSNYLATSSSGVFVDVGANLGWHAVHAAQHNSVETVVAFEPDAFNAWLLDRNLALNGIDKAIISTCAVGARPGTAGLHRYKSSNYGRHSLVTDHGFGSRTVPMTDLDTALDALGLSERRVLILKIDVEGYEPAVIVGAKRTLARTEALIIEYSPELSKSAGLSLEDMLDHLQAAGFAPRKVVVDEQMRDITIDDLRQFKRQADVIWTKVTPN